MMNNNYMNNRILSVEKGHAAMGDKKKRGLGQMTIGMGYDGMQLECISSATV